jgi:hypothetical protein
MKRVPLLLAISFILICVQYSFTQNILELPYKSLNEEFSSLTKTLKEVDKTDYKGSIDLCIAALDKFQDMNIRNNLIFWELSFHYASLEQYDKCFEILKRGQDEGLFYFMRTNGNIFPPYLKELEKFDGYEAFIARNSELKDAANQHKTFEFMVQLPTGYTKKENYPLMLIMHGGIGSIPSMQFNYLSEKLQEDFIVVYTQGDIYVGSYSRAYSRDNWNDQIISVYRQIISRYTVDTTQIILAGPSAGAYRSLLLGLNNSIPAKGLLLSFAVYPTESDSTLFIQAAEKGLKVALLCGENDWAIKQQKKLGYYLDKYGIENRFVVFPDEGHEFPENWPYYLETSVDFILNNDE